MSAAANLFVCSLVCFTLGATMLETIYRMKSRIGNRTAGVSALGAVVAKFLVATVSSRLTFRL